MSRTILAALGCLLGLGLPLAAQTVAPQSAIRFVVANQSAAGQCVRCVGPRFRDSGAQRVQALAAMERIFTARITDLPPYGGWTCRLAALDPDTGQCASEPLATTDFCLPADPASATVTLTIGADRSLSSDQPRLCGTDATGVAFLGSRKRSDPPDRDRYAFTAAAGNAVIVTLEPATRSAARGRAAVIGLRHRGEPSGVTFSKVVRGALPLRLEATMPATGAYEIWVAQPGGGVHGAFRGFYRLSLRSNVLGPRLNADQDAVELAATAAPPSPLPSDNGCYRIEKFAEPLDGAIEIRNQSPLTFRAEIKRRSDVLVKLLIEPRRTLTCCRDLGADDTGIPSDPLSFELEARENGVFVGSLEVPLTALFNKVLEITAGESCLR